MLWYGTCCIPLCTGGVLLFTADPSYTSSFVSPNSYSCVLFVLFSALCCLPPSCASSRRAGAASQGLQACASSPLPVSSFAFLQLFCLYLVLIFFNRKWTLCFITFLSQNLIMLTLWTGKKYEEKRVCFSDFTGNNWRRYFGVIVAKGHILWIFALFLFNSILTFILLILFAILCSYRMGMLQWSHLFT